MNRKPNDPGTAAPASPRRRSRLAIAVPIAVAVLTVGVLAWSAWPVIRPARSVEITQAVFDRAAQPAPTTADDPTPPRSSTTVQAAGWLEAEPFYTAAAALADGIVETIEVLEGDYVEKDQVVARLVSEDAELALRRAQADLAAAESALALAEADLRAAQASWDDPVELDRAVESNSAALEESNAELAQLPALIDAARATLGRVEEEFARARESSAQGAATELEVVIARQNVATRRAELAAIEARQPILEARVARLKSELRAAQRDLQLRIDDRRRLDAAHAQVGRTRAAADLARASRDIAALELDRMTVRAPISGYVQTRLKIPGDKAIRMMDSPESAHILHLYDPSRLQVRVDVPLADASHVFVGQRCEVVVEVLPDKTFAGEVLRITHEADLQKNTLQVKVAVTNPDPILRPEMLTRVRFLPESAGGGSSPRSGDARAVLVPSTAIDTSAGAPRVWLITQRQQTRGVVRPVAIESTPRDDGWASIRGPVQPGALIALPDGSLSDGQAVRFNEGGA
ncbi:MAG: efflux RND transporter periplasmic adaptor subunit [Phycisphaerales bacterium]